MAILAPHFSPTFTLNRTGAAVVEQGSSEDLVARAANVLVCPISYREDTPDFGIPELLFDTVPLNVVPLQEQVQTWAALDATVTEHGEALNAALRSIGVEVSA